MLKVVPLSPPASIRSPKQIAMNEVSTEPIAQATEEVTDVAENVESIDAPPVTGLVEPVRDQVGPTETVEQVTLVMDEFIPSEVVEHVAPAKEEMVPAEVVVEVPPEPAEAASVYESIAIIN